MATTMESSHSNTSGVFKFTDFFLLRRGVNLSEFLFQPTSSGLDALGVWVIGGTVEAQCVLL